MWEVERILSVSPKQHPNLNWLLCNEKPELTPTLSWVPKAPAVLCAPAKTSLFSQQLL